MSDKVVITCALNGVLTDPKQHNVPVTPEQMAREAKAAYDAGANTYIVKPVTFLALVRLMKIFTAYWLETAELPR